MREVRLGYCTRSHGEDQVKTCKHCGKEFPIGPSQKTKLFCTSNCAKAYHKPSIPIRIKVADLCHECGNPILQSVRGDKRYCSITCRNKCRKKRAIKERAKVFYEPKRLNAAPPQSRIWD